VIKNLRRIARHTWPLLIVVLALSCDDEESSTDAGAGAGGSGGSGGIVGVGAGGGGNGGNGGNGGTAGRGGAGPGGQGGGMGPTACVDEADCANACPPGAVGCTCVETPRGSLCIPTCNENADCPEGVMGALVCNDRGFCAPEGGMGGMGGRGGMGGTGGMGGMGPGGMGGMGPGGMGGMGGRTACVGDADCEGACAPNAAGCGCADTPMGTFCAATCGPNAECPEGPNGALVCQDNFCGPEGMMGGGGMGGQGGGMGGQGGQGGGMGGQGGGMGPASCNEEADCANACPPGTLGCTCSETPMGRLCVPTCVENADCPEGPNGQLICREGICAPEGGGMMPPNP
jgi:hypothetical protein